MGGHHHWQGKRAGTLAHVAAAWDLICANVQGFSAAVCGMQTVPCMQLCTRLLHEIMFVVPAVVGPGVVCERDGC